MSRQPDITSSPVSRFRLLLGPRRCANFLPLRLVSKHINFFWNFQSTFHLNFRVGRVPRWRRTLNADFYFLIFTEWSSSLPSLLPSPPSPLPPQLMTPKLRRTSLPTAMDRVVALLVAATGTAPLVSAYHPAMHPTSSQSKTLAVMPHVVRQAIKSSAANISSWN